MTDNQRADHVRALIAERDGYLATGRTDRAAQVEKELRRLGADAVTPAKRATRRVVDHGSR